MLYLCEYKVGDIVVITSSKYNFTKKGTIWEVRNVREMLYGEHLLDYHSITLKQCSLTKESYATVGESSFYDGYSLTLRKGMDVRPDGIELYKLSNDSFLSLLTE